MSMGRLRIFLLFFRIGALTFGGGLAMVGVMRHELVARKKLLTEEEFTDQLSVATAIPGAIAVNMGLSLGNRLGGPLGAAAGLGGVILPSFLTILFIVIFLSAGFDNPVVQKFFHGAAGAVTAQIAYSALRFGKLILTDLFAIILATGGLAALLLTPIHPILVVAASLVLRMLLPTRKPTDSKGQQEGKQKGRPDTVSDEDADIP